MEEGHAAIVEALLAAGARAGSQSFVLKKLRGLVSWDVVLIVIWTKM